MTTPNSSPDKFVRLSRPAIAVVHLTAEHEPSDQPVSTGEWVRLSRPALPVVTLVAQADMPETTDPLLRVQGPALPVVPLESGPVESAATIHLKLSLVVGADGNRVFERLHAVIGKVNEVEALGDRAGVQVDGARSGVRGNEVVIVLAPNDPTDAVATCKRVANILFNAAPGATVKVFAADQPGVPVYDLAP